MGNVIYDYRDATFIDILLSFLTPTFSALIIIAFVIFFKSSYYSKQDKSAKTVIKLSFIFFLVIFIKIIAPFGHSITFRQAAINECYDIKCYKIMRGKVTHIGHDLFFSRLNVNSKDFYIDNYRSLYMIKRDIRKIKKGDEVIIYYLPDYGDGIIYLSVLTNNSIYKAINFIKIANKSLNLTGAKNAPPS